MLRIPSLKMDREWSLLHTNPLLPEFNLPTKEERHMQNRNVQLRAEYRKRDDRSLSLHPELKNEEEDNPIWSADRFVPSSYQRDVFLGELELDGPVYG
jgi:hypothetical protein